MARFEHRAEHLVAIVPQGCSCPWGQVHEAMPWQKLATTKGCTVHDPAVPREDLGGL